MGIESAEEKGYSSDPREDVDYKEKYESLIKALKEIANHPTQELITVPSVEEGVGSSVIRPVSPQILKNIARQALEEDDKF